jgi:hypothetical protein
LDSAASGFSLAHLAAEGAWWRPQLPNIEALID